MDSENTTSEVVEIGRAEEVIRGKGEPGADDGGFSPEGYDDVEE
jgi:hypothetical protein